MPVPKDTAAEPAPINRSPRAQPLPPPQWAPDVILPEDIPFATDASGKLLFPKKPQVHVAYANAKKGPR